MRTETMEQKIPGILEIELPEDRTTTKRPFSLDLNELSKPVQKPKKKDCTSIVTVAAENRDQEPTYVPANDEELFEYAKGIGQKCVKSVILNYWDLGRVINEVHPKEYGKGVMDKLNELTGINADTLRKICKFARKYSWEDVQALVSGLFMISWNSIAQNLTVAPEKLIDAYKTSDKASDFNEKLVAYKSSYGKVKTQKNEVSRPDDNGDQVNDDQPEAASSNIIEAEVVSARSELVGEDKKGEEIKNRSDFEDVVKKLQAKEKAYDQLQKHVDAINQELDEIHEATIQLEEMVKNVLEMLENGAEYEHLYEGLRKTLDSIPKISR
ncbi:MAG: hypothetical protein C4576_13795 [Desulfobacteraceae bacterium]|nr:MAG: hypothetical protein C4576_13795 [Desulfobacteraceae bacterium]